MSKRKKEHDELENVLVLQMEKTERKKGSESEIIKILNTKAIVTVHICTNTVALMHLCTILHSLM